MGKFDMLYAPLLYTEEKEDFIEPKQFPLLGMNIRQAAEICDSTASKSFNYEIFDIHHQAECIFAFRFK